MLLGFDMSQILQQLVNGLALGSVYALIALGYTMVYGIVRLINFAHGDVFMLGAYYGFFAITRLHIPFILAMPIAMGLAALTGVIIERLAYRPLRQAPRIAALITAIGVSLLIQNLGLKLFESRPRPYPQIMRTIVWDVGGVVFSNTQIVMLGVALLLMVLISLFVYKTKTGKALRAVAFDRDAARLMGIDSDRIILITFALGSALAAAGGVLVGFYYNRITPTMGTMYGLKAFVAAVVGGIGIVPGAMLGGVIMGIAEVFVVAFVSSTLKDAIAFAVLIVVLLVKPAGLLGRAVREKV
ncbi:MAG: High-affinity branched-chain amino acid transport system permease protein LivH [Firmicutes bacterium ADurb.Bin506]|nr:MAG: High-affinity branched-chain amino acid transport system permease protein LivH [Firmicutes bacterium ADurb.Bin506]